MSLEQDILQAAQQAISKAVTTELVGYNKPLSNLAQKVIAANEKALYDLINTEVATLIGGEGFKATLKDALNHKLAKLLIDRMGGELEKRVNELKADPSTRARITLAIEDAVKG